MKKNMRIMRIIPMLLVAMMVFAGCTSAKEQSVTYKQEDATMGLSITMTYYAKGDEVTKQTAETVMMYEPFGITDAKAAEELMANQVTGYDDVKGVEHSIEYLEDRLIEKTAVDYSVADVTEVAKLTGSITEGEVEKGTKISLKMSVEALESQGFTKVEDATGSSATSTSSAAK